MKFVFWETWSNVSQTKTEVFVRIFSFSCVSVTWQYHRHTHICTDIPAETRQVLQGKYYSAVAGNPRPASNIPNTNDAESFLQQKHVIIFLWTENQLSSSTNMTTKQCTPQIH